MSPDLRGGKSSRRLRSAALARRFRTFASGPDVIVRQGTCVHGDAAEAPTIRARVSRWFIEITSRTQKELSAGGGLTVPPRRARRGSSCSDTTYAEEARAYRTRLEGVEDINQEPPDH